MKKYFLILLATMAFVACNDEVEEIDYSTLTLEELLATGGGVDYLVRTSGPIDESEITKEMTEKVLYSSGNDVFWWEKGWVKPVLYGCSGSSSRLLLDNQTYLRYSLSIPYGDEYEEREFDGDVYTAFITDVTSYKDAKVVAYVENVLVLEYTDIYNKLVREIAYFQDTREKLLNRYNEYLQGGGK